MSFYSVKKSLRNFLKDFLPYSVQRRRAALVYGVYYPDLTTLDGWRGVVQKLFYGSLPFGLVRRWKELPQNGMAGNRTVQAKNMARLRCKMPLFRRRRLLREREEGVKADAAVIEKNKDVPILVILHLFYDGVWPVIQEYLKNLAPYRRVDWVFTVTEGYVSDRTLKAIQLNYPGARIIPCQNRGFDLWPFVRVLKETDLSRYEIVFKLHTKGFSRPYVFIYDQIFKYGDWFFNLFDGILGGRTVHRAIDMLVNEKVKLTAAENLIVHDPKHKVSMVRNFCREHHLPFCENYRFVAGTCFAVRAEMLKALQNLSLDENDFQPALRGTFFLAHVLERWICFAAQNAIRGIEVPRKTYAAELKARQTTSALRLLDDDRFMIDDEFFYRELEMNVVRGYEVVRLKLKAIKRRKSNRRICSLADCEAFQYLCGKTKEYEQYCQNNREASGYEMSRERFDKLIDSINHSYDPTRMPVVQGKDFIIRDGQHRCCVLWKKYGPDHEIEVLHFW